MVSGTKGVLRVGCLYAPNGNPLGTEKFPYKLAWMARLHRHAAGLLRHEEPLALMGDYNVIPGPLDAANPGDWSDDALFQPESREAYRSLLWSGLTDAWAEVGDGAGGYTFWDYQAGAWPKNNGIRIDHALLSPQAADRLVSCRIDRSPRGWEKPSDHTPLMIDLNFS